MQLNEQWTYPPNYKGIISCRKCYDPNALFSYRLLQKKSLESWNSLVIFMTSATDVLLVQTRGVRNPMKMSDIRFLKTEPTSKFKNQNSVSVVQFSKNRHRRFGDGFSRCLIHNSSCSMIGSTVKVFFFMPYLCTSSSESLRLTVSWTNSTWKALSRVHTQ